MSGDPVTLQSIAAMAKERLGKEPKMLSQLSFSGDLSNLSEEDVDKLLNLVQSLQDDKSAIFDPQGRKNLKRTIQSLEGSIGLDMDTTKSNIFSAMDKEAGFMDKPFVAAKKKAIDMALGKIMSEELDDEAPEMQNGGKVPPPPPPPPSGGGSGYGGGTNYSYSGGGVGVPGYGSAGVDMSGSSVSYLPGQAPAFGGALQANIQTALGMLPEQFQQTYNQMYAVNPEMAGNYLQNYIQEQGGMEAFLGDQFIDPTLYGPFSDKPGGGAATPSSGGGIGNFFDNVGSGDFFQGQGGGFNFFDNIGNGGNNVGNNTGLPGGADSAVGPREFTYQNQSQIPQGFSLNREKGGMLQPRKKPRVYQFGGDMDMSSDYDNLQGPLDPMPNQTQQSLPTPEAMLGAASTFEKYAPEASLGLMQEYRNILADQRAAEEAAAGGGEGGEAGVAGGVSTADNPLGLTEQDLAYLEMLPPAQRAKEIQKLQRMQKIGEFKEGLAETRQERADERGAGKDFKDRTKEEKKETIKEGLKLAGSYLVNPLAAIGRLAGLFEDGGKVSKKSRTYKMYQEGGRVGPRRRLTRRYGEMGGDSGDGVNTALMMRLIDMLGSRKSGEGKGRRRGLARPMFDRLRTGKGRQQRSLSGSDNFRQEFRGGPFSGKPETMLDARGDMVSIRQGAGDSEGIIRLLRPYMDGSNRPTSPIDGNTMQSDPRPGMMTDSDGNPVMGTTNPFASSGGSPSGLPAVRRGGGMLSPFRRMDNGGSTDPKKKKVQVRGLESSLDMQIDDMIKQGVTPDFDYSGLNESQKNALYDAEINYLKKTGQYGSEDDEMEETQPSVLPDAPRQQSLAYTYGITSPADMDKPAGGFNMRPVKTAQPQQQRTVNMSQGKTVTPSRSAMPNREQREFLQMRYESSGDPNKQSAYAAGLYGISPAVMSDAAKAGAIPEGADVFDPEINKKARDWFLDSLSEQEWIKNPPKPIGQANRLARIYGAYNEGPGAFKKNLQLAKDAGIDIYGDPAGWIDAKGKGAKYDGYFFPKETRDYVRGIVLGKIDPTRVPRGYKLSN